MIAVDRTASLPKYRWMQWSLTSMDVYCQ